MTSTRLALSITGLVLALAAAVVVQRAYSDSGDWAAKVDGREISEERFLAELEQLQDNEAAAALLQIPESSPGSVSSGLSSGWLSRLVQDQLVEIEVERRDVRVSRAVRARAEAEIATQFGGLEAWSGFDEWFQELQTQRFARLLALTDEIGGQPTEAQLRAEFEASGDALERACTSHVLVETREGADSVTERLGAGEEFADLARELSIDQGSAENGGEIGCFGRGEGLVAPYEAQMFALEPGEVSEPVETQFGFHVIRLERIEKPSFEEARPQLESALRAQAQQRFAEVMTRVLDRADIEINPKYGARVANDPAGRLLVPPSVPDVPDGLPAGDDGTDQVPSGFLPSP